MLRHQRFCINKKNQQGFSLIELMIALVVGMIVMGMTYNFFISQVRVSSTEMKVSNMQMNTHAVLRFLKDHIRNAGYGVTTKVPVIPVMVWDSDNMSSSTGSGGGSGGGATSDRFENIKDGTDCIDILSAENLLPEMKILGYNAPSQKLFLEDVDGLFDTNGVANEDAVGNLILVFKDGEYVLLEITQVQDAPAGFTNLVANPGWGINSNAGLGYDYTGGTAIYLGDGYTRFYVYYNSANKNDPKNNTLRYDDGKTDMPLLSNVLSMQIVTGDDTDLDGAVDNWVCHPSPSPYLKSLRVYLYVETGSDDRKVADLVSPLPVKIGSTTCFTPPNSPTNSLVRQYMFEINGRNLFPISN